MTGTNHAVTGAIIGAVISPVAAIPLAIASHFALDWLPHYGDHSIGQHERKFRRIVIIDTIVAVTFLVSILIVRPAHWVAAVIAALFAMSPDIMWLPNFWRATKGKALKPHNKVMHVHERLQRERVWGWMVETAWLLVLLPIFYLNAR